MTTSTRPRPQAHRRKPGARSKAPAAESTTTSRELHAESETMISTMRIPLAANGDLWPQSRAADTGGKTAKFGRMECEIGWRPRQPPQADEREHLAGESPPFERQHTENEHVPARMWKNVPKNFYLPRDQQKTWYPLFRSTRHNGRSG